MAASKVHGFRGKVVFPSFTEAVRSWSATKTSDTHEVTGMHATNTARERVFGLHDWTATVTAVALEAGPGAVEGESGTLELWLTQTQGDGSLNGTGIVTGVNFGQDPADAGTVEYTFQITGGLTWTLV